MSCQPRHYRSTARFAPSFTEVKWVKLLLGLASLGLAIRSDIMNAYIYIYDYYEYIYIYACVCIYESHSLPLHEAGIAMCTMRMVGTNLAFSS